MRFDMGICWNGHETWWLSMLWECGAKKKREIQLIVYDRGRKTADVTTMADAPRERTESWETPGSMFTATRAHIQDTRWVFEYEPIGKATAADGGIDYPSRVRVPCGSVFHVRQLAVVVGAGVLRWPRRILNRPKPLPYGKSSSQVKSSPSSSSPRPDEHFWPMSAHPSPKLQGCVFTAPVTTRNSAAPLFFPWWHAVRTCRAQSAGVVVAPQVKLNHPGSSSPVRASPQAKLRALPAVVRAAGN